MRAILERRDTLTALEGGVIYGSFGGGSDI